MTLKSATKPKAALTKSDLITRMALKPELALLSSKDIKLAVNSLVDRMSQALAKGNHIEIRGFGTFSLHRRKACVGRNPKTGEKVLIGEKRVPHFKPGRVMRERVDQKAQSH